ncbi:MAG: fasciclin domain-containing protein [Chloroflexi bacterium]|nr:fasciclin domain-containing protein [Chloroflexota bacterium]MCC6891910.1 substrate-binding domain-containing protein [Anaerolineae bacterium]
MKNRIVVLLAVLLVAVIPFMNVGAQDQTIVEAASGNADFSTLVQLAASAGLAETLSGEGPFTVYAPTNEAFAALPQIMLDYLTAHPEELTRVLSYHVVAGEVPAEGGAVASVEGSELTVGEGVVDDANIISDIEASNGVIHAIDTVLLPPAVLPEVTPAIVTGDIAIDGSSTVGPVTVSLADSFKTDGYSGNITVGVSGTGGGFKAFCEETRIDIAGASRAIKVAKDPATPDETEKCVANGLTPIPFRIGTDGIAIVTSSANTFATDLTTEEVKALFSTAINWSDVRADFPAEPILRYVPGTSSGTFDYFVEVIGGSTAEEREAFKTAFLAAGNLNQSEDDNVIVQGVESSEYAVGFFGYAYYEENAEALHALALDGVTPNFDSVEGGTYKLSRPLFLYSAPSIIQAKPQVADFINYYLTNVPNVISEVGYFPAADATLNRARWWYLAAVG